jgi:nucleoside-diphosphate-sugar epimerase
VLGTERLLAAMAAHDVDRLVLVSSISVYDFKSLRPGDVLDEATPLEPEPQHRDAYVRGKLAQERLAAAQPNLRTTVVRPGAVYGAGRLWDAGHALQLGPRAGIAIGPSGRMKLTFVENCAEALVRAAERSDTAGTAVNVVDDGLPTQREFAAALARHGLDRVRTLSIPYRVAAALANLAWHINRGLLRDRLPLPGLLVPSTLAARYKPLEYSNATARRALGWAPRYSLDEALARVATEPS